MTELQAIGDYVAELEAVRDENGDIDIYELPEGWDLVVDGDWTQEHKYQNSESIVKHVTSGRHFCINRNRSGSYHSDWYYGDAYVCEVQKVTKTITVDVWEAL